MAGNKHFGLNRMRDYPEHDLKSFASSRGKITYVGDKPEVKIGGVLGRMREDRKREQEIELKEYKYMRKDIKT